MNADVIVLALLLASAGSIGWAVGSGKADMQRRRDEAKLRYAQALLFNGLSDAQAHAMQQRLDDHASRTDQEYPL